MLMDNRFLLCRAKTLKLASNNVRTNSTTEQFSAKKLPRRHTQSFCLTVTYLCQTAELQPLHGKPNCTYCKNCTNCNNSATKKRKNVYWQYCIIV